MRLFNNNFLVAYDIETFGEIRDLLLRSIANHQNTLEVVDIGVGGVVAVDVGDALFRLGVDRDVESLVGVNLVAELAVGGNFNVFVVESHYVGLTLVLKSGQSEAQSGVLKKSQRFGNALDCGISVGDYILDLDAFAEFEAYFVGRRLGLEYLHNVAVFKGIQSGISHEVVAVAAFIHGTFNALAIKIDEREDIDCLPLIVVVVRVIHFEADGLVEFGVEVEHIGLFAGNGLILDRVILLDRIGILLEEDRVVGIFIVIGEHDQSVVADEFLGSELESESLAYLLAEIARNVERIGIGIVINDAGALDNVVRSVVIIETTGRLPSRSWPHQW